MVDINHINSAEAYVRAFEEERREKRIQEQKDFRKEQIGLATVEELRKQNQLLAEQNKNAQIELIESKRTNRKMFNVALVSLIVGAVAALIGIASLIISLVK